MGSVVGLLKLFKMKIVIRECAYSMKMLMISVFFSLIIYTHSMCGIRNTEPISGCWRDGNGYTVIETCTESSMSRS